METPRLLSELWQIYLDAYSPGGWFESHERDEKGLKTALKYWGQEYAWLSEVETAAFEMLRPDNIGGIPQPQDPKDHPIIQDIKVLQSEVERLRAENAALRREVEALRPTNRYHDVEEYYQEDD